RKGDIKKDRREGCEDRTARGSQTGRCSSEPSNGSGRITTGSGKEKEVEELGYSDRFVSERQTWPVTLLAPPLRASCFRRINRRAAQVCDRSWTQTRVASARINSTLRSHWRDTRAGHRTRRQPRFIA